MELQYCRLRSRRVIVYISTWTKIGDEGIEEGLISMCSLVSFLSSNFHLASRYLNVFHFIGDFLSAACFYIRPLLFIHFFLHWSRFHYSSFLVSSPLLFHFILFVATTSITVIVIVNVFCTVIFFHLLYMLFLFILFLFFLLLSPLQIFSSFLSSSFTSSSSLSFPKVLYIHSSLYSPHRYIPALASSPPATIPPHQ